LRIASFFGFSFFFLGLSLAVAVVVAKVFYTFNAAGWASLVSLILVLGGVVLLVLGIIAEYVGVLVRAAIGRPVYVITNDRQSGPLYRQ
jgi:undecaprenyl-phosphate 4-deoxy-4-formamido-L-arabinose transferase